MDIKIYVISLWEWSESYNVCIIGVVVLNFTWTPSFKAAIASSVIAVGTSWLNPNLSTKFGRQGCYS